MSDKEPPSKEMADVVHRELHPSMQGVRPSASSSEDHGPYPFRSCWKHLTICKG